jgi:hypothetical protein
MKNISPNLQRATVATLLLVAVIISFVWVAKRGWVSSAGAATNVELGLAKGRDFADAYFVGSGSSLVPGEVSLLPSRRGAQDGLTNRLKISPQAIAKDSKRFSAGRGAARGSEEET